MKWWRHVYAALLDAQCSLLIRKYLKSKIDKKELVAGAVFLQKIVVRKTLTNLLKLWPRSRTIDTQTLFALSTDFLPTLNFTKQIYTNLLSNRPTHTRRMNDLFARVLTFEIVCGMRQERVTRVACAHGKTEVQLICCSSKRERVVDSIIKMPTEPF